MLKQFFRDSILYTLVNFLTRGISFILLPFYTRVLTQHEVGILDFISVICSFLSVSIALEVNQGLARYMSECREDLNARRAYSSSALSFSFAIYTILVVVVFLWEKPLAHRLLGTSLDGSILQLAAVAFWINALTYAFQLQLRWTLRSRASAIYATVTCLVTVSSSVFFVVGLRWGLRGVFLGQIAGGGISAVLGYALTRDSFMLVFDVEKLKRMLAYSIPLVPSSVGVVAALFIDRIVIRKMLTLSDVGVYGVGYRIASVISLTMVGFQSALTPLIYAQHRNQKTREDLARLFRWCAALGLVFFMCLSFSVGPVLDLLAPRSYQSAVNVVPPLTLAILFAGLYVFAPGLEITKCTKVVAAINVTSAIANTGLSYLLVPRIGIQGAAYATFLTSFVGFVILMIFSQRHYYVPHLWRPLWAGLLCAIVMVLLLSAIQLPQIAGVTAKMLGFCTTIYLFFRWGILKMDELQKVREWAGDQFRFVRHRGARVT